LIIIPNLGIVSKPALQTVDSLINRSGLANASKSNIYTDDIRLKSLFPAITYEPNAGQYHTRYAKDGFGIDSIRIQRPDNLQVKRITDTSFLFTNIGGVPTLTVNDKTQTEEASRLPIELNTTPVSEVVVDGNRHFFAIRQTVKPRVFINPDASALLMTFNPALISLDKKIDNTQVLLGVHGFNKQVSQKAVFYIPNSLKETEKDLGQLGATVKVSEIKAFGKDSFDIVDNAYFRFALTDAEPEVPLIWGQTRYTIEGYSIPIIRNSKGQVLVSLIPNAQGNTVVFMHTTLASGSTNLTETELFLPLIYSLAKNVVQTGTVEYYDLCNRQNRSAVSELTASSDSIFYRQGFVKSFLPRPLIDKMDLPGIYQVFKAGDMRFVAVNEINCTKRRSVSAYIVKEGGTKPRLQYDALLLALLATFVVAEGLVLSNRLRRR
jgi:hypothetical protein